MSVNNNQKNNNHKSDWHRADIIAALHKSGWSLRQLAFFHGYPCPSTLSQALNRPFPKGERLIANAIGVDPEEIWPTRFQTRRERKKRIYG